MPKENKKRGRRMASNKRKYDENTDDVLEETSAKRRRSDEALDGREALDSAAAAAEDFPAAHAPTENAFFGMLDQEEQDYFKRADEMLEMDSFANPEERTLFVENVYREADGKELKIAHSQSCSRLMERLIRQSSASQLKDLFQRLSGNFIHLLTHRFASHCCEALFTCAAPIVSEELTESPRDVNKPEDVDKVYVSTENLFLHAIAELEGNVGFLMTDQYGSHALRILLLVLSGEPISNDTAKTLVQSRKKEGIGATTSSRDQDDATARSRAVPKSFSTALNKLIHDSTAGLDTPKLRALATHPIACPTLQLLLKLELTHFGKQRGKDEASIIRKLLPDEPFTAESDSAAFINGLVYDPVGSHLVERIIENAPAKLFKALYSTLFKERLASYARHEMTTYVNCRIIERLGSDDLLDAHQILIPIIPDLLERNWTALVRVLIYRCTVREIDTQAIAVQIDQHFQGAGGFDVEKLLKLNETKESDIPGPNTNGGPGSSVAADVAATFFTRVLESTKVHFNILAQEMLAVPGSLSSLILQSLVEVEPAVLLKMAHDNIVTRTIQHALTTKNASIIERRKLIQRYYGNIGEMALDKSASHVVDCIWEGTHGLAFIRERIAEELAENEDVLRNSTYGRAVWRNWKMDMYKRRRAEWVRQSKVKASNDGFQSFSEIDSTKRGYTATEKTPLQLAQERHAQAKAKHGSADGEGGQRRGRSAAASVATGANSTRRATADAASS